MLQAGTSVDQYKLHAGDVHVDRDTVLSIWQGNLGEQAHMRAKYDWFYLGCPFGPPLLQLLRHVPSGIVAGTCAAGRRRMLWRGQDLKAGVMVDLAVHPEHRSLGPALTMQKGLIQSSLLQSGLVYGFPNPRATAIFRRLGARKLVDIVRLARVLRPGTYLRRRFPVAVAAPLGAALGFGLRVRDAILRLGSPAIDACWTDRADERMDELWARSPHGPGLLAVRDAEHLRWRFDEAPLQDTRYLLLSTDGGKSLAAWFATQVAGDVLHVRDFWTLDAATGVGTAWLDALVAAARRLGMAAVSVEIAARKDRLANWHARGFVKRSQRPVYGFWQPDLEPCEGDIELLLTSADEDE